MHVRRKTVVRVLGDLMMTLPCRARGIDMKRHAAEVREMV